MRNWQNSYKTLKSQKMDEKKYPLWYLNNFVRNSAELFWSSDGISLSHNNTYEE